MPGSVTSTSGNNRERKYLAILVEVAPETEDLREHVSTALWVTASGLDGFMDGVKVLVWPDEAVEEGQARAFASEWQARQSR